MSNNYPSNFRRKGGFEGVAFFEDMASLKKCAKEVIKIFDVEVKPVRVTKSSKHKKRYLLMLNTDEKINYQKILDFILAYPGAVK